MITPAQARRMWIGGEWIATPRNVPVLNPATGERIAEAPIGGREHLEAALAAAQTAFKRTRLSPAFERADLLLRVAHELERRQTEFVETLLMEAGKPIALAEAEVSRAISTFTAAGEESRRMAGEMIPMDAFSTGKGYLGMTRRFPIGCIYALTPFNFPLNLIAHKVAPCLATGNVMIVKPAPKTPLTALLLGEVLQTAGVVPGQMNIVPCANEDAGHLVGDPRVAMVSFTGSPAVGWRLKERCGRQKITLELGGNAAVVVHEDADLARVVSAIASGGFDYAGQSCISVQRVLVHRPVYEAFRSSFLAHIAAHVRAGDPRDRSNVAGPMIDPAALERVLGWIRLAVSGGATLLTGGTAHGPYLDPTVLENVTADMEVCSREVFAPLVVLQSYERFEDALAMVNDSDFGLQAGVFTQDVQRAFQAFETLEVGAVLINTVPTFRVEQMPYGGVKQSGFGREGIRYAMEDMTEIRSLILKLS